MDTDNDAPSDISRRPRGYGRNINDLPPELLAVIFEASVAGTGNWKLLDLAKVCRLWEGIVSIPSFWEHLQVDANSIHNLLFICRKRWTLETKRLVLVSVLGAVEEADLPLIFESCPNLTCFMVENTELVEQMMIIMTRHCHHIEILGLSRFEASERSVGFNTVLNTIGDNLSILVLKQFTTDDGMRMMNNIANHCPNLLELLLENSHSHRITFPIAKFQIHCEKLTCLCIANFNFHIDDEVQGKGFPKLKRFCCPFSPRSNGITDEELIEVLKTSQDLNALDIRGTRVTTNGLKRIPATTLEYMYIVDSPLQNTPLDDFLEAIERWEHSLIQIDNFMRVDLRVSLRDALSECWPVEGEEH